MAHELEILQDGSASMFYVGATPWHGMGTEVEGVLTAAEAIKRAHLDWVVEKAPIYVKRGEGFMEINDRYEIRRDRDLKVLGIVGPDYKIIQNREAFDFFDTIVDDGEAKYETAGSLFGGKRIWLTAKIGDEILFAGEDPHHLYLLLTTSHDGSRALTAAVTMIRAVCNNTVTMGLSQAKAVWSMTHKQDLAGKVAEARDTLGLTFKYRDEFDKEIERLLKVGVTNDQFKKIIEGVLPEQKRQKEKNVARLMDIFENEPTIKDTAAAGNGWGAYNAMTYWLGHAREVRSLEARMTSEIGGFGSKLRDKTRRGVLALA